MPRFSANRMVCEYVDELYADAANSYRRRTANKSREAVNLRRWRDSLVESWYKFPIESLNIQRQNDNYIMGDGLPE